MFKNTLDNKRYYTLNCFYRKKFKNKVFKVPLDAHMSCPNKKNGVGCIYCEDNSKANITDRNKSIEEQFLENIKILEKKWPNSYYIPYFQAGTNTYANVDELKKLFEKLLDYPKVVGLSIATRCDCLNNDVLDYLSDLNKRTFLTIEMGLQSSNDETLKLINRGHTKEDFVLGVKKLKDRNIFVCAHIINGLINDNIDDMVNTAKLLNDIDVDAVKIHMLYIAKGTKLDSLYKSKPFHILSKEEYTNIVIKQLEYLNEDIVVERITGDPIKDTLVEPTWLLKKFCVLNDIDKEMVNRNTYQGKCVK